MKNLMKFSRRNPTLVVSSIFVMIGVLCVIVLPVLLVSPTSSDPVNRFLPPFSEAVLGTDSYGRDILSRLVSAGQISLSLAAAVTATAVSIGTMLGMISGYFHRAATPIMRLMDAWMAFPSIVLAMLLAVTFGAGFSTVFVALSIIFIPFVARIIRSRVLSLIERPFVEAAGVAGMGHWKRLFVHVLPNVLPLMLVQVVIVAAQAILVEGALSFLGIGVAPPTPSWGNMIAEGRAYIIQYPSLVILPGLAIAVSVILLNLIGAGLRALADPRAQQFDAVNRARDLMHQQARSRSIGARQVS